jgi:hypothetical protein
MDKPALAPWGTCVEGCERERTGTIEATLSAADYSRVELLVTLPGRQPERVVVPITDQIPRVVPLTQSGPLQSNVVVTPYLIPAPERQGLRTLYDCKVQAIDADERSRRNFQRR